MPNQNPATAGITFAIPSDATCSMAGINKLQIDAATITPDANPINARCTNG